MPVSASASHDISHMRTRYSALSCLLGKYCGRTLPESVNASAQSLYIIFHSDELDAFKGFKAEWTSTAPPTIESAAHGKCVAV